MNTRISLLLPSSPAFLGAFPDKRVSELTQFVHTVNNTIPQADCIIHKLLQAASNQAVTVQKTEEINKIVPNDTWVKTGASYLHHFNFVCGEEVCIYCFRARIRRGFCFSLCQIVITIYKTLAQYEEARSDLYISTAVSDLVLKQYFSWMHVS